METISNLRHFTSNFRHFSTSPTKSENSPQIDYQHIKTITNIERPNFMKNPQGLKSLRV